MTSLLCGSIFVPVGNEGDRLMETGPCTFSLTGAGNIVFKHMPGPEI